MADKNIDEGKRDWLKKAFFGSIIGIIVLSLLGRKSEALYFESQRGTGYEEITSSIRTSDAYKISDIDDDASPNYYGFIHSNGT